MNKKKRNFSLCTILFYVPIKVNSLNFNCVHIL